MQTTIEHIKCPNCGNFPEARRACKTCEKKGMVEVRLPVSEMAVWGFINKGERK